MNRLNREIEKNIDVWERLSIECFKEHHTGEGKRPFRAYLTSKILGGTLAVTYGGDGWSPVYPEKPNYPIKGRWFSPNTIQWKPTTWERAVMAALDPVNYTCFANIEAYETAKARAAKLRHQLRALGVIAMIKEGMKDDRSL